MSWRADDDPAAIAERRVRGKLEAWGYFVIPMYAIEDGNEAPCLRRFVERHVLPDLQAWRAGRGLWIEVKWKDSPDYYQKAGEYRHGVDLPKWDAYLEVERETGVPGYLAIVQCRAGKAAELPFDPILLIAPFAYLATQAQRVPEPTAFASRGMVYWPVDAFEAHPIDLPQPPVLGASTVHPWHQAARDGRVPHWEPNRQGRLWEPPSFPCRTKPER
jgi:hypothetical protein